MDHAKGTELHEIAASLIKNKIKLHRSRTTMSMYVNDCIGFRMTSEQVLFYSYNCFGTADAIDFRDNKLRIFDLKTGSSSASMDQLKIYAAMFCLEYEFSPSEIQFELRIYQNDAIEILDSSTQTDLYQEVRDIMDRIISADRRIEELKAEVL